MKENLLKRITLDADKCGNRPCIRHMRIRVTDVLNMLASDMSKEEILEDYPYLEDEDITAVLLYAARQFDHPMLSAANLLAMPDGGDMEFEVPTLSGQIFSAADLS